MNISKRLWEQIGGLGQRGFNSMYLLALGSLAVSTVMAIWTLDTPFPDIPLSKLNGSALTQASRPFLWLFVGLIVGVVFTVIGFLWDAHKRMNLHNELLRETYRQFEGFFDCRYLGIGTETLGQVMARTKSAKEVKNTFVFFGTPEHESALSVYPENDRKLAATALKAFLIDGGSWTDIASTEILNSSWMEFLGDLFQKCQEPPFDSEHNRYSQAIERYRVRRIKASYPIINFMILRYGDGAEEVIFGWGHHSEDPVGKVFLSKNPQLISTFSSFWRILEKDSALFDPRAKRMLMPADIAGLWFRVSFKKKDAKQRARDGVSPSEQNIGDVALVKIAVDDYRNIIVSGKRFKASDEHSLINTFTAVAADIKKLRLWFSTDHNFDSPLVATSGWYRFLLPEPKGYDVTAITEFFGEFSDYDPEREAQVGAIALYGTRVPVSWLGRTSGERQRHLAMNGEASEETYLTSVPNDPNEQRMLIKAGLEWWKSKGAERWSGSNSPAVDRAKASSVSA